MTQIKHPLISFGLVTLQFGLIALLLLFLNLSLHPAVLAVQTLAILIGLWALFTLKIGHFNIIPDPQPDTRIVTHGPYRFIRHPMYLSLLLFFLPMVMLNLSWLSAGLYAALFMTLLLKLTYEEDLLVQQHPEYSHYQLISKKLLPWLL
jgi:protein-S-isoprenylcysteine O-methyltransferase Ste14